MIRTILIVFLAFGVGISLSSIEHKTHDRECELYNSTNCAKDGGECEMKRGFCKDADLDKPSNCFVLWSTDNHTGEVKVSMKGCFTYNHGCKDDECVDTSYELNKGLNFCCCSGNMCNQDHKWVKPAVKPTEVPDESTEVNPKKHEIWQVVILTLAVCLFICSAAYVGYQVYLKRSKQAMFNELPTKEPELSVSLQCLDLRPIQLLEIKARGRFGTVWKGLMKNEELAVKIFPCQDKDSWVTEHEIYKLARMNHPNILHFIGAEKHVDPTTDFWLITEYHAHGSLCDYLKAHTVTWPELCKIAESMARGLQHLHEEIPGTKTEGIKPAVAHRDFKSKNVLLKNDLTACIADFGLALIFAPGKPCGDTHGQVGTRRYMAPEILEGAINFTRDSFLRIDVYACGLVLWELVTRCTGHGGPVTEFSLPFEAELGSHPTLEEMQENIVTKKMRPQIYDAWRTHLGLNAICDTIEECWDHDAEARLSSSCIMERVSQHTKYQTAHPVDTTTNNLLINNTDSI